jgi:hypothetical protein
VRAIDKQELAAAEVIGLVVLLFLVWWVLGWVIWWLGWGGVGRCFVGFGFEEGGWRGWFGVGLD